jgi:imidazolonepropionase
MLYLFRDINKVLTLEKAANKNGRKPSESDLTPIQQASILVDNGKIAWVGESKKIPKQWAHKSKAKTEIKEISLNNQTVLPGFVECHTHSLFAGDRTAEFEQRNMGVSYQEINAKGGGIRSTMRATRKSSNEELRSLLEIRLDNFISQGVTTVEVKTGYALDLKNELRCLKVLNEKYKIQVIPTYLGAHSIPPEFSSAADYLDFIRAKVLPKIKKLTNRVDIFIERGFFEFDNSLNYLTDAKKMGFQIAIHADQLSFSGGADAALMVSAKSADHLLMINSQTIESLAKSEVTCVLLPTADLYMKSSYPKAREMIDSGCRVALATDYNPGSSPTQDIALVGLLARLEMKMSLPEVITAYTVGAAHALGLERQIGSLQVGHNANFISTESDWNQLFYSPGLSLGWRKFYLGKEIKQRII